VRRVAAVALAGVLAVLACTVPVRAEARSPQAAAYAYATAQAGKPFAWGADGPQAFDCSGLVYAAYRAAGIRLPRDTYQMIGSRLLERISRSQARRGDLAFFGPPGAPYHVALVDSGDWIFSAYEPGEPAGWSRTSVYWQPSEFFRVAGVAG